MWRYFLERFVGDRETDAGITRELLRGGSASSDAAMTSSIRSGVSPGAYSSGRSGRSLIGKPSGGLSVVSSSSSSCADGAGPEKMLAISEEVIERNEALREAVGDFTVTQFVTRGPGRWAHQAGPPAVCVKVAPIVFERYARHYTEGAPGVIARTRSSSSESLDQKCARSASAWC